MKLFNYLFVLFAAGLLMISAATATAGPKDFSACDVLKGTGAGYGICRAGVVVGCADGTGNLQACMNIEENFLATTGLNPPWRIPDDACPCYFDLLSKDSPPWSDESAMLTCNTKADGLSYGTGINIFDGDANVTRLETGYLDVNATLSCRITEDGKVVQQVSDLTDMQNDACKRTLLNDGSAYWNTLYNEPFTLSPGFDLNDDGCTS